MQYLYCPSRTSLSSQPFSKATRVEFLVAFFSTFGQTLSVRQTSACRAAKFTSTAVRLVGMVARMTSMTFMQCAKQMAFATPLEMIKREAASTKDDELMRNA